MNAAPEHAGPALCAARTGVGLTATVTVNAEPTQEELVGVNVYTAFKTPVVELINVPISVLLDPDAPPLSPVTAGGAAHA